MKKYLYLLLIASAVLFTACSNEKKEVNGTKTKQEKTIAIKKSSGSITLKSVSGEAITVTKTKKGFIFSNAKGKLVLITFFATWCPPCKAEIPHLNNLQEKYKGKIKIIGILIEKNKDNDEIKKFMNYHAVDYTITNSQGNFALADAVGGVTSIPFMVMYNKNGDYITHYLGAIPEEMIDSDIESALKK